MALGIGYKSKIKVGKEGAWGTPADINSAEFIPFASESLKENRELVESKAVSYGAAKIPPYQGNVACSGGISVEMTYQDLDLLLAAALGQASDPAVESVNDVSYYKHVITLTDDVQKSFTTWVDKVIEIQRFDGCKVNKLTIKGEVGQILVADFDLICKRKDPCCQSGVGEFELSGAPRILFKDVTFWLGQIAAPLGDSNKLGIASFELSLDNKLKGDDRNTETGVYIMEPVRNDKREVTLKIKIPRYMTNTFRDYYQTGAVLQAMIKAELQTGYYLLIELPELVVAEEPDPNIGGAGIMPVEITFNAYANKDNSNMDFAEEMRLTIRNKRSVKIW